MKKKNLLFLLVALFGCTVTVSCGGQTSNNNADTSTPDSADVQNSLIASVTARSESVSMKLDSSKSITDLYTVNAAEGVTLTSAQKACTYSSSNKDIISITGKAMLAVGVGSANITVTSKTDTSKSCVFAVTVEDIYFDRDISTGISGDNFEKELPADGGEIITEGMEMGEYYVKGIYSTKWMITSKMSLHETLSSEDFPKIGLISTVSTEHGNNKIAYFLNAERVHSTQSWSQLGICEVSAGTNWAWNPTINDAIARHRDNAAATDTPIKIDDEFEFTLVRDGFNFHMFYNGTYKFSVEVLHDLFGDDAGEPVPSYAGLFQFNSNVTFKEYSATADAATVDAKIASITETAFVTEWTQDKE